MYQHVLFATDLTHESLELGKRAQTMANGFGAQFSIIHVVEPQVMYVENKPIYSDILKEDLAQAQAHLSAFANQLQMSPLHCHLQSGKPKLLIASTAKEIGADLIIMASHGTGGSTHAMGSTTSNTLHFAECDMLVFNMRNSAPVKIDDDKIF